MLVKYRTVYIIIDLEVEECLARVGLMHVLKLANHRRRLKSRTAMPKWAASQPWQVQINNVQAFVLKLYGYHVVWHT